MGEHDGVVMALNAMSPVIQPSSASIALNACSGDGLGGAILVHEVGHWLGLQHIFGSEKDASCNLGDNIADTGLFPREDSIRYCCQQPRCNVKDAEPESVINWMSVSIDLEPIPFQHLIY